MPSIAEILIILGIPIVIAIFMLPAIGVIVLNIYTNLGTKYSRLKYWLWSMAMMIILIPMSIISKAIEHIDEQKLINIADKTDATTGFLIIILLMLPSYIWLNALINRIRDYGSNPWIALWTIVPLANIFIGLYYGIAKHKSEKKLSSHKDQSLAKAVYNHSKDIVNEVKPSMDAYREKHQTTNDNTLTIPLNENKFNQKEVSDELLYEYVMEEMEEDTNLIKGLWAKAMAYSEGNNERAKSLYMQYRVQSIQDDLRLLEIDYSEFSKEKLWDAIKNSFMSEEEKLRIKKELELKQEENEEQRAREKQKEILKEENRKYEKIGGWLIFFAIILVIGDLSYLEIFKIFTNENYENLTLLFLNDNNLIISNINLTTYFLFVGLFFNILLTISFFTKSSSTRSVAIVFFIWNILYAIIIAWLFIDLRQNLTDEVFNKVFTPQEMAKEYMRPMVVFIMSIIWILYFIFSKRVKKTFTVKTDLPTALFLSIFLPAFLAFGYYTKINELSSPSSLQMTLIKLGDNAIIDKRYDIADKYYNNAIQHGVNPSLINDKYKLLASDFFNKEDYKNAIKWYKKASLTGYESETFNLAYSYNEIKQYNKSIKLYKEYIKNTDSETAMNNLSYIYRNAKKDYRNSIKWAKKAIKEGYDYAFFGIGYCYDMLKDYKNAEKWYLKSIKKDNEEVAMWNLGLIYEDGKGKVKKDLNKALKMYENAWKLGYKDAKERINIVKKFIKDEKKSKKEDKRYWQQVEENRKRVEKNRRVKEKCINNGLSLIYENYKTYCDGGSINASYNDYGKQLCTNKGGKITWNFKTDKPRCVIENIIYYFD